MRVLIHTGGIALILLLLITDGFSQPTYGEPSKIVPQAPNNAAFQRFTDIPVSPYTGVPNISVPIYSIKSGDIQVPVSINYHASGIKVADEASRVGLGWALNATGVITRTVMNMDDFASRTDAYHSSTTTPDLNDGAAVMTTIYNVQPNCNVVIPNNSDVSPYLQNSIDFEPDVYNFSFSGYSGSFIMKRNKQVVLLKSEKLSITYLPANGSSFEIKTPDGSTYLFEEKEDYLDYFSPYSAGAPVICAWHLTRIVSPKGDVVDFIYQKVSATRIRVQGSYFASSTPMEYVSGNITVCRALDGGQGTNNNTPAKEYSKIYLDRINFKNGYLKFYNSPRIDIESDVKLDSVQLVRNTSEVLRRWIFYYDYFVGTYDEDQTVGSLDIRTKRLKLKALVEKGKNGDSTEPYTFTYNDQGSMYPQKTSFALDHWGYYNGQASNMSPMPEILSNYTTTNLAARIIGTFGENRDPDPTYNQMFVLKEIKYPTGGKTMFEYETNDFDIEKSKVNDFSFFKNYPEVIAKQITKTYPGNVYQEQPVVGQESAYMLDLTDLYVNENDPYPTAEVNLKLFMRFNGDPRDPCLMSGAITGKLCNEDGSVIASSDLAFHLGATSNPKTVCVGAGPNYIGAEFTNNYMLPKGKYIYKILIPSSASKILDAHLTVDYYAEKKKLSIINNGITLQGADFGGGLRINRILNYDNIHTGPVNVKRYQYHGTDANGKNYSYGRRMVRPVYAYFDERYYSQDCNPIPAVTEFETYVRVVQSEPVVPVHLSASGSSIGYDTVIVYEGELGENGKTVYEFENQPTRILDYSVTDYLTTVSSRIPRKPPSNGVQLNYANGNVLSQTDYKNSNGKFVKVRQQVNSYSEHLSNPISYAIERRQLVGVIPATCQFESFVYPALAKTRKLLSSSTVKTFDYNSDYSSVDQTTTYQYNHTSHLQLIAESTTDSKGRIRKKEYKYPLDYSDAQDDNAIASMKGTAFMHNIPVVTKETYTENGSVYITNYAITKFVLDATSNKLVPAEAASLDQVAPTAASTFTDYLPSSASYPANVTAKMAFSKYDAEANLVEFNKTNDVKKVFVWDYLNQCPIAEVTNAAYSDVAHTSFEADGKGNWNFTGSATTDATAITGAKVFQVSNSPTGIQKTGLSASTTYIVSYWTKNASAFSIPGTQGSAVPGRTVSGWKYFEHVVTGQTQVSLTGVGLIDELRLYPKDAQMTTYTYDVLNGMSSQCNAANMITYYEYDNLSRLQIVRDQNKNIIKTIEYQYKQ